MPKIQAYRSRFNGKIYTTRQGFARHLREQREFNYRQYRINRVLKDAQRVFAEMRETCSTFSDIEAFIIANSDSFVAHGIASRMWGRDEIPNDLPKILTIKFERMNFKSEISNSLVCPLNGVTNWHNDPNKPLFYRGWIGLMRLTYENRDLYAKNQFPVFDWYKGTGIATMCGSGGFQAMTHEVVFFEDDWPTLSKQHIFDILSVE